ncbi:DUF465 domain-containing protein [Sphingomonas glaciei]|uniref:DUF465 domain-containing protein n=1 Tax=Sphingomonas glaciei TaxID=2938948 RepID=A0ABY5MYM7_9SPHN|nr:DUF465 domain-containing protein [Sphingomonas glaciei]UUR08432.1 DUF465 domain-containing protein [Sphingomonas glaciei]
MNDDQPTNRVEALRAEHRQLDAEIAARVASGDEDLMTLARLKKRKLRLKDELQMLHDAAVPDIIA